MYFALNLVLLKEDYPENDTLHQRGNLDISWDPENDPIDHTVKKMSASYQDCTLHYSFAVFLSRRRTYWLLFAFAAVCLVYQERTYQPTQQSTPAQRPVVGLRQLRKGRTPSSYKVPDFKFRIPDIDCPKVFAADIVEMNKALVWQ